MSATILFNQSMREAHEVRDLLQQLESSQSQIDLLPRITALLDNLQRSIADLEQFAKREVSQAKRDVGISRSTQLKQEYTRLSALLSTFKRAQADQKTERERSQLLQRASAPPAQVCMSS